MILIKQLLYITKLISSQNEEVLVYISLEDFQKYLFTKKGDCLDSYKDKALLDVLNNVDGIMYKESFDGNIMDNNKKEKKIKKITPKEKLQRTLAILGVGVTIISLYPKAAELVSYSLKNAKATSYSGVVNENTSDDEFINQFIIAINKNDDFLPQEKEEIIEGFERYFSDWGYLFEDVDKQYVLNMAQNVNVNRNAFMPDWASGDYFCNNINLKSEAPSDNEKMRTLTHEAFHAFSDRGLLIGTVNGFGFGYALNEGINTSVNSHYCHLDDVYSTPKYDVLRLSFLIDNENFIKAYQKEGPSYVVQALCEEGINYFDAVKYISMMDIELFIDDYRVFGYTLPERFHAEKEELYNKMFRVKYDYDFSESVLGGGLVLKENNFLFENFDCEVVEEDDGLTWVSHYKFSKEDLTKKNDDIDYSKWFENKTIGYIWNYDLLILLDQNLTENLPQSGSLDAYCANLLGNKFKEEDLEKAKSLFRTKGITEENVDYYARFIVDYLLSMDQSPEFMACYVRWAGFQTPYKMEDDFKQLAIEMLKNAGRDDVVDLYTNTTIHFDEFNCEDFRLSEISTDYNLVKTAENYIINDNKQIIVKLEDDEFYSNYDAYNDNNVYLLDVSEEESKKYDAIFGCDNGRYCYGGIGHLAEDDIKIFLYTPCNSKVIDEAKGIHR